MNPDLFHHTFEVTVEVDQAWVDYLTKHSDIFFDDRAGYWLRGIEFDDERGWLCWEEDEEDGPRAPHEEPNREEALRAWKAGEALPKHWFRLDRAAALRAWEEGVKRYGELWYEDVDSTREDSVVQLALLGEIRYG